MDIMALIIAILDEHNFQYSSRKFIFNNNFQCSVLTGLIMEKSIVVSSFNSIE